MGNMAVAVKRFDVIGAKRAVYGTMSFSNSYATGGDMLTAAALGLSNLEQMLVGAYQNPFLVQFNLGNTTVQAFSAVNTEVANATDMSGTGFDFIAVGV